MRAAFYLREVWFFSQAEECLGCSFGFTRAPPFSSARCFELRRRAEGGWCGRAAWICSLRTQASSGPRQTALTEPRVLLCVSVCVCVGKEGGDFNRNSQPEDDDVRPGEKIGVGGEGRGK